MSTSGALMLAALVIWAGTEIVEFVLRRRAGRTALTSDNKGPGWVRAVNVVALALACTGFVMFLTTDLRFFGLGL